MAESSLYAKRLEAIVGRRKVQERLLRTRRELEEEKLRAQQLKRKSLRDQWLMDGTCPPPENDPTSPLGQTQARIQELEKDLSSLQAQMQQLDNPAPHSRLREGLEGGTQPAGDACEALGAGSAAAGQGGCSSGIEPVLCLAPVPTKRATQGAALEMLQNGAVLRAGPFAEEGLGLGQGEPEASSGAPGPPVTGPGAVEASPKQLEKLGVGKVDMIIRNHLGQEVGSMDAIGRMSPEMEAPRAVNGLEGLWDGRTEEELQSQPGPVGLEQGAAGEGSRAGPEGKSGGQDGAVVMVEGGNQDSWALLDESCCVDSPRPEPDGELAEWTEGLVEGGLPAEPMMAAAGMEEAEAACRARADAAEPARPEEQGPALGRGPLGQEPVGEQERQVSPGAEHRPAAGPGEGAESKASLQGHIPAPQEAKAAVQGQVPLTVQDQIPSAIQEQIPSAIQAQILSTIQDQIPSAVQDQIPSAIQDQIPSAVQDQIPSAIQDRIPSAIQAQIPSTIQDRIPSAVQEQIPSAVQDQIPSAIQDQIPSAVQDQIPSAIQAQIPSTIQDQIPSAVQDQIPSAVQDQIPSAVQAQIPSTIQDQIPSAVQDQIPSAVQDQIPSAVQGQSPSSPQEADVSMQDQIPSVQAQTPLSLLEVKTPAQGQSPSPDKAVAALQGRVPSSLQEATTSRQDQVPSLQEATHPFTRQLPCSQEEAALTPGELPSTALEQPGAQHAGSTAQEGGDPALLPSTAEETAESLEMLHPEQQPLLKEASGLQSGSKEPPDPAAQSLKSRAAASPEAPTHSTASANTASPCQGRGTATPRPGDGQETGRRKQKSCQCCSIM
ncbi:paralemmin-3 isoform X2 [Carettochelys insculpta]|uniref:paralemmin-3 isoform X2 n=1 Tax=Carettochelys insculpta TaxID=44489 RepID=UPI003EBEF7AF